MYSNQRVVHYLEAYSLDGVFGGLGAAGLGVGLVDCGGVAENSTEVREASSSIASSLAGEDVFGTAIRIPGIVPSFLNNDDNIPYICIRHYMIASWKLNLGLKQIQIIMST